MFEAVTSDQHMKREREQARMLRKSRWWQTLIAKASCYYCGVKLDKAAVTMDHVVPLAQGGRSTQGNVVPSCKSCNTQKRDLTAAAWLLYLDDLRKSQER
mgnify:CR=1 FL=1